MDGERSWFQVYLPVASSKQLSLKIQYPHYRILCLDLCLQFTENANIWGRARLLRFFFEGLKLKLLQRTLGTPTTFSLTCEEKRSRTPTNASAQFHLQTVTTLHILQKEFGSKVSIGFCSDSLLRFNSRHKSEMISQH